MSRFEEIDINVDGEPVSVGNPMPISTNIGVPTDYCCQTSNARTVAIQKGQINHYRLRPAIINEHCETARQVQSTVTSTNVVGQIFKASQDNINGITLTIESAAGVVFDDFEGYADSSELQDEWDETDAGDKAELETTIVAPGGSTKSMMLPGDATVGDEWVKTITATDYTDYTGDFEVYQSHSYSAMKLRFFIGDGTNTKSIALAVQDAEAWEHFEINENALTEDQAGTTDTTQITKVGYRLEDRRNGSEFYIDNMVAVPPPGSVGLELWDMGTSLPASGVTALDDGTQYEELGDRGFNSGTVVSSVHLELVGGKRQYTARKYVAGTALEIPSNTLLTVDNYYAIVLKYIDTEVNVYGSNTAYTTNYYTNGYAFTTPNDSTAITQIGTYNDLQFGVFSTQDVYLNTILKFYDNTPGNNASESVYIEDKDMKIAGIISGGSTPQQSLLAEFRDRVFYFPKGGKFEVNHNDDFTDSTSQISLLIGYIYKDEPKNG